MSLRDDLRYWGITQREICKKLELREDEVSRALSDTTGYVRNLARSLIEGKKIEVGNDGYYREVTR